MSFNNNIDNNLENTGRRQVDTDAGSTDPTLNSTRDDAFRGAGDEPGVGRSNRGNVADFDPSERQQRQGFGNTDMPANTTGGDFAYAGYDTGSGTGSGVRDDRDEEFHSKPSMGDKLRGNLEQAAGKVMRNAGMQEKGQERKAGQPL